MAKGNGSHSESGGENESEDNASQGGGTSQPSPPLIPEGREVRELPHPIIRRENNDD
jgi:hypothetical protein